MTQHTIRVMGRLVRNDYTGETKVFPSHKLALGYATLSLWDMYEIKAEKEKASEADHSQDR